MAKPLLQTNRFRERILKSKWGSPSVFSIIVVIAGIEYDFGVLNFFWLKRLQYLQLFVSLFVEAIYLMSY